MLMHDNYRFEVQNEASDYVIGTKQCSYGFVNKQWSDGCASIQIECGGQYSKMEFSIGHVNDTGGGDKTLNIDYLNTDGEYQLTCSKPLYKEMPFEKEIIVDILNTETVKIEYKGSYSGVRYGMTDVYFLK